MVDAPFEDAPVWFSRSTSSNSTHGTYSVLTVTGSSQGLGRALLDAVLASGQRAVATLRKPDVLAEYQEKYSPTQLLISRLDVADGARIVEVFKEVKEHFGRVDVVVNNAGYGLEGEIETTPDGDARKIFEVLFWGVVNISKQVCAEALNIDSESNKIPKRSHFMS